MTTAATTPSALPVGFTRKLRLFASDIKISHTIFAMPWALLATFLAAEGLPPLTMLALILVCMVTARTVAMASNRLLDARLDARNPRTASRALPAGKISGAFYTVILLTCAMLFIAATIPFYLLYEKPWPVILSVPVLLFIASYPLLKRFTRLCHYYLGAALALAPLCAWLAVSGTIAWPPIIMAAAVLLWTAGFDIIYACQDYHSDIETGVFSIPARLGIAPALWISKLTHVLAAAMLIALGLSTPLLGTIYYLGAGIAIALLIVEHSLVRQDDLTKVNLAFFTINGIISIVLATLGIVDVFV